MKIEKDKDDIIVTLGERFKIVFYKNIFKKPFWRPRVELDKRYCWFMVMFLRNELAFYWQRSEKQRFKFLRKELVKKIKNIDEVCLLNIHSFFIEIEESKNEEKHKYKEG